MKLIPNAGTFCTVVGNFAHLTAAGADTQMCVKSSCFLHICSLM